MKPKLHVCFTMDVERIKSESPVGGPPTWEFAEIAVRSYCEFLGKKGFPATLFIVPDTAEKQAQIFLELKKAGHECGMHLHPQAWRDHYRNPDAHDYLGGYTAEEQCALLDAAKKQFSEALGFDPVSFRGGNFSANDDTFRVLEALRFRCSSVSQPGRCAPKFKAVWTGAPRAVHRAHRSFRFLEGDLDLVEIPPTVDSTRTDHWTGVGDARLEDWDTSDILRAIEDSLKWQIANQARVHHLCLFTHNTINYSRKDVEVPFGHIDVMNGKSRLPVLEEVLEAIPDVADRNDLSVEGCTLSTLRERYLARMDASNASIPS